MKRYVIAALFAAITMPAIAADLGGPASKSKPAATLKDMPAPSRPVSCYADAGVSMGVVFTDFNITDAGKLPASPNGLLGQIGAGCDYRLQSGFAFGAFGFYNIGEMKTKFTNGTDTVDYKVSNNWALGGRLGYLLTDTTLLYGRLGYTAANASVGSDADRIKRDLTGIVVGLGVETQIMGPVGLRFGVDNYRYKDLKVEDVKAESSSWTATTGLVFRF